MCWVCLGCSVGPEGCGVGILGKFANEFRATLSNIAGIPACRPWANGPRPTKLCRGEENPISQNFPTLCGQSQAPAQISFGNMSGVWAIMSKAAMAIMRHAATGNNSTSFATRAKPFSIWPDRPNRHPARSDSLPRSPTPLRTIMPVWRWPKKIAARGSAISTGSRWRKKRRRPFARRYAVTTRNLGVSIWGPGARTAQPSLSAGAAESAIRSQGVPAVSSPTPRETACPAFGPPVHLPDSHCQACGRKRRSPASS